MTLQQLRYIVAIVEAGSLSGAAQRVYVSQPCLSKAVADLEDEMGITIFVRTTRGISLTEDGTRFLAYARQVLEQADLLTKQFKHSETVRRVFAISAQHYAFVVNAFVALVKEYGQDRYEFSLRESRTYDIIEDVRTLRSELGVIYLCNFNREVMLSILKNAGLKFVSLFTAKPHVFVSNTSPLASYKQVTLEDLKPFPRLTYEQGINNSFYFAEELHITEQAPKSIVVTDRATLFNLLIGLEGYTISSGVFSQVLNGTQIVSIPLVSDEIMDIGVIMNSDRPLNHLSQRYIEHLTKFIADFQEQH